ncbi:MAG: putative phosphoesterase [halophilic archaeon J07HX64]|jgi:putative phosphoesterase|nr:MAG: putative phosphoesterase [halophilic archaeon J07HX64]
MSVEPVPDAPAAVASLGNERALVVADYHAGIEYTLQRDGVELDDRADGRRRRLLGLLAETDPDRLVVLGDLLSSIGEPQGPERAELTALLEAVSVPTMLVKGNHDGDIGHALADLGVGDEVTVTDSSGIRLGPVGFAHGHTWPDADVLGADTVCIGHEHPLVRLTDEVGGGRLERTWLRGSLDPTPFAEHGTETGGENTGTGTDLVVFPAFNNRSGGTRVNDPDRGFLAPFLPAGLSGGQAYLLDGTRLGPYEQV